MDEIQSKLSAYLKDCESMPFLFVGSGISQRYIATETWEELLRLFAGYAHPEQEYAYELYKEPFRHSENSMHSILPQIASAIEVDFNRIWFTDNKWKESRERNSESARRISPFKIEIGEHFKNKILDIDSLEEPLQNEVKLLKALSQKSVSGIITTNYDTLLESIFSDFKVFVVQEELLFSNPQSIAEIYKIHGCCLKPATIVINSHDYEAFHMQNAYLAAKLLTIFMEHPIIFLGYSLNDSNIERILKSIVDCLSQTNLGILQNRLIFVEFNQHLTKSVISTHDKSFPGSKIISMIKISTNDFTPIYNTILQNKSKYPTSILRKLKEDIYKLVLTNDPKGNLFVKEFEDIGETSNIDIVAGIGIIREMGEKGYDIITNDELYKDVVLDDEKYNHRLIVELTLPRLFPIHSNSVPMYKYIKGMPEKDIPDLVKTKIKTDFDSFICNSIKKDRVKYKTYHTVKDVSEHVPFPKCLNQMAWLDEEEIDVNELEIFLRKLFDDYPDILSHEKSTIRTNTRRLIKIYDWLKYYKGA